MVTIKKKKDRFKTGVHESEGGRFGVISHTHVGVTGHFNRHLIKRDLFSSPGLACGTLAKDTVEMIRLPFFFASATFYKGSICIAGRRSGERFPGTPGTDLTDFYLPHIV